MTTVRAVDFVEYLRFERDAPERHELIGGEIVARPQASRRHNILCGRLHDALRGPLGHGPRILERSDQRMAVNADGTGWVFYYPDLAVYRDDAVHPLDSDTRIAPTLLVEVTSNTTEKSDRGVKLKDYLQMPTLDEYLIVSHDRVELELWTRGEKGWTRRLAVAGTLRLESGASIVVEDLYANLPPL